MAFAANTYGGVPFAGALVTEAAITNADLVAIITARSTATISGSVIANLAAFITARASIISTSELMAQFSGLITGRSSIMCVLAVEAGQPGVSFTISDRVGGF